ncbi:DEAD/DEAH box helicase family protein [Thiorhodococcus mannitoliphagus]|uniref:DEAD/DEAH box helicase family protein n=1 Tax=Thiorhodococcus mannitoliphagus TaxID=329406 RepID=A0A6P1DZB2_9GAMM|nr:DEAD/DEAH box helicase family protein [Thiorhodococcus mannitoliphagus]NEX21502.1 DEAD/DEAH box helicase family protein [Thiorhodococcus mannitoliphagus]
MSQFAFLQAEFSPVFEHASKAETLARSDPRAACFYARLALETAVGWMYQHDGSLHSPYDNALSALIHEATFRTLVGNALVTKARLIKDYGNRAVHDIRAVSENTAVVTLRELFHIAYWLVRTYAKGEKPAAGLSFSADALPQMQPVEVSTLARLQALAEDYAKQAKAREEAEAAHIQTQQQRDALDAQLKALRAEIAATKQANQTVPDAHDYNEAQTRDAFIDLLLHEAGWALDQPRDREFPVTGMPNQTGTGFVDNVLWGDDGKPLALVESKRTKRDAREGQQQVKLYGDCVEARYGRRPILFYTNGYEHWLWDDTAHPPRPVQGFLKKDELELLIQRRTSRKPLATVGIDERIVERYYQTRAIRRLGDAFELDHLRKALLVMATGSGKTRMVIAAIDQLMRAGWIKRALFLADRVALVNQAIGAFKLHLPHAAPVNLVTDKDTEGRIYVSTYPTMVGLIDSMQNGVRRFGSGHFDLLVIDEAHRSVYRKYRAIFDYFDSYLIGLTATPRDEIDRDTYSLFELERGVPTDAYDLEQAVADGFLVPPKAVSVPLKFQREGIRYDDLSDAEKEQWDALEWTEDGEIPDRVDPAALNKWLFNADTVDKVLAHVMTHGLKVQDGDRLGKTILFAKNHAHAVFIAERFDAHYPHLKGHFARVIDFKTEYAQSLIDDFSDLNKAPHIAISVDMLDTGIDVPEVVNLVFFKIVRSKTKFWQMIGRGTRLCPDLFGPGQHKEHFLVFDFCQNFEFFNQNPNQTDGALGASLSERLFVSRVELIGEIEHGEATDELLALRAGLVERLQDEVAGMSLDNFIVRPKRRFVEKFQDKDAWQRLSTEDRAELAEHLAGLPSAFADEQGDDDLAAKQFDYLLLMTQLAVIRADLAFANLQARIIAIAAQLEELGNIPMVKQHLAFIAEVQTDEYWQDITLPMLEHLRRRLRALVKLIEPTARKTVYSDFEDEIGESAEVYLAAVGNSTDKTRFLMKVRHFLTRHTDHITIQKLRRNEQLTSQDISELQRIFIDEGVGTDEDLERIQGEGGLGLFIRSLVGLDREAAKQALGSFMEGRTLSANQIEFVTLIIDHLTERGAMDPRRLYESPFTDLDDQGVAGLFSMDDARVLISVLKEVEARAAA